MFIAQAHSFVQQARLAITLAWIAGYTNIITVITCGHVTSHVSGTASDLGRYTVKGDWFNTAYVGFLLVTFGLGAMVSGFVTEFGRRRGWESIYVLPMAVEAVLLAVFAIALEFANAKPAHLAPQIWWLTGIASLAMGVQNATITRISSGVVRTTHVTGVLTDLGLEIVQFLYFLEDRRRQRLTGREWVSALRTHPTGPRLMMLLSVVLSFALGAALGTAAYGFTFGGLDFSRYAMFPPVAFLLWLVYQDVTHPIAEIEESDLVAEGLELPPGIAVFALRKDPDRRGRVHRMPNLLAWSERLPLNVRVVVLDLAAVEGLAPDSAVELRALHDRLVRQRRGLVVAGINSAQYREIASAAQGEVLDPGSICADLELAIARGLNLLDTLPLHAHW